MENTLAEAWADMVADLPVGQEDVEALVNQVLDELSEVAAPADGPRKQSEHDKPFQLEHGFSITYVQNEPVRGGGTRCMVSIESPGRAPLVIGVQLKNLVWNDLNPQLGVTAPGTRNEFTDWTPEEGPQKEWVLRNLRQRIAEYIFPKTNIDAMRNAV